MIITVSSKDEKVEVYNDSNFDRGLAFLCVPGALGSVLRVPIRHSDIDSVIEALESYKKAVAEVMGSDYLK